MSDNIQKLLKGWRKTSRLSQGEASRALGVPRASLENWEQGRTLPRAKTLMRILRLVGSEK